MQDDEKNSSSSTHCTDCVLSGGLSRTLLTFLNFKEMARRKSTLHRIQNFKVTTASPLIIKLLHSIHFLSKFAITKITVKEFRTFILFHYSQTFATWVILKRGIVSGGFLSGSKLQHLFLLLHTQLSSSLGCMLLAGQCFSCSGLALQDISMTYV